MLDEDNAKDSLRAFSNNTHYLFDWRAEKEKSKQGRPKHFLINHQPGTENSRKLLQKKYEKKQDVLCRFQYPIVHEEQKMIGKVRINQIFKNQGLFKQSQIKRSADKKPRFSKLIDKLVEEQFRRVSDQVFTSFTPPPIKVVPSQTKKIKRDSLPFIVKNRIELEGQRTLGRPAATILIDNDQPPVSRLSRRSSTSFSLKTFHHH